MIYNIKESNMKKTAGISIPSSYIVITTTILYALLAPIFFEMDNAYGESENFVVDDDNTMTYSQQYQVYQLAYIF